MMGIRKIALCAAAALACAAYAAPQAAAEGEWMHEGVPLESMATFGLSGTVKVEVGLLGTSVECEVDAQNTIGPEGEGEIVEVEFTECQGKGGAKDCVEESRKPTNMPWGEHIIPDDKDLLITDATWDIKFKKDPKCPLPGIESTATETTVKVFNPSSISYVTLSGLATVTPEGGFPMSGTLTGELEVTGEDAGTYGIE